VVSGVNRGMGVLDGGGDRQWGRDSLGVNLGHPIVNDGYGDVLFPDYFWMTCYCHLVRSRQTLLNISEQTLNNAISVVCEPVTKPQKTVMEAIRMISNLLAFRIRPI